MSQEPFAPVDASTVRIALSSSSNRVLVARGNKGSWITIRIVNLGSAAAWIRAGDFSVVAVATNIGIGPGVHELMRFAIPASGELHIAAIAGGSTGDIEFTPGDGI